MSTNSKVSSFYENGVFQDFYKLLEVDKNATKDVIKSNYRRLSRKFHPDAPTGNEEKMKQLSIAYGILNDDDTKRLYDEYYTSSDKQSSSTYCYNKSNNQKNNSYKNSYSQENRQKKSAYTQDTSKSYTSQFDFRKSSFEKTIYFSRQTIQEMLRKCGYKDLEINSFLLWCGIHNVKISTGKELHTQFAFYQQSQKSSKTANDKTIYFSKQTIREMLKKDGYADLDINSFLLWCGIHNVQISTRKELHAQFASYQQSYGNAEMNSYQKDKIYSSFYSFDRNFRVPKRMAAASVEEPRLSFFGQLLFNSFIKQYCYQSYKDTFYRKSLISNLVAFSSPIYSRRIVLYPYFSTAKAVFYTQAKSYTYRRCA